MMFLKTNVQYFRTFSFKVVNNIRVETNQIGAFQSCQFSEISTLFSLLKKLL